MAKGSKLNLLKYMRPIMALLPEVDQPDKKVMNKISFD